MPTIDKFEEGCTLNVEGGLQVGDTFLEVDGEKIYVQSDFSTILALNPGDVHDLVVERNGQKVELKNFKMEKHDFLNKDGTTSQRFGIIFEVSDQFTLGEKLSYAWKNVLNAGRIVRLSLQMLLTGEAGVSDMSGPVGIVGQMNQMAQASPTVLDAVMNMLYFGGFLAINLAIMNMLPFPALDGGRLVFVVIRKITGKAITDKMEGVFHMVGMVLLLMLMVYVTWQDILRFILPVFK
jgi:regulator of sigma E protease